MHGQQNIKTIKMVVMKEDVDQTRLFEVTV